ncbi:polyprenol phosphomannose-dependent alpha 1,6 mannosyltransferase MptB [Arthrobacter deserti]|uniref:Polyprenol phosphomannose-dependent alpha 1,6 mannosyltransferase MptB n=1 Tax=Arthrobacter deserti TaxID=1742687 RepID=A0ABX1JKL4_9MICC|nr:polyprenol phosphomannose-dependent alpha 1,6 mannosyltransferase MptB [Arthrobacter deserti]
MLRVPAPSPATDPLPLSHATADGGRYARTIIQGALGSVFMFFGSLGVGWLASVSELRRWPLLIWLRHEPAGDIVCVLLLADGGMLLVRSWLRLGQQFTDWGPEARRAILTATMAWAAPLAVSIPLFSRDVYAYIAQGKVMVNNLNPYVDGYDQLQNYLQTGADDLWARSPTPYGPIFLWLEELVVWLTGGHPGFSIILFRLLALAGAAMCIYFGPKLAELHGINPNRALWLACANPLFLTTFIASNHNVALMLGLALGGLYFAATRRPLLGILLVTLSVGIKPITLIFLPFIGLLWAGREAGWLRKFAFWAATAGLSLGMLGVLGLVNGLGFGWIGALGTQGAGLFIWYAPVGLLGMALYVVADGLGFDGGVVQDLVYDAGKAAAVVVVLFMMFRGGYGRIVRRLALALAAVVCLAPVIQPWYIVWLLPLFAATGIRNDWQVRTVYAVTSFLMVYAIADQLDIFPYIDIDLNAARLLAAATAVGFALYLVFLDPRTRRLFRRKYMDPADRRLF